MHLAAGIIALVTLVCVTLFRTFGGDATPYIVAWFGSFLSLVVFTVTDRNNRKNNTTKMLVELRSNQHLHRHRMNIFTNLGYNTKLRFSEVRLLVKQRDRCSDWEANYPVLESLAFVGNLYEHIAYGVRNNDLDRSVVRNSVRGLIIFFYEDYFAFIQYHHEIDSRRFEHLIWLAERFGTPNYHNLKKNIDYKQPRFKLDGEKLLKINEKPSVKYKLRRQKRIEKAKASGKGAVTSTVG
ncbi:MAG: DUF4760 domain-containing protein [Rhodomicrobium sp.]